MNIILKIFNSILYFPLFKNDNSYIIFFVTGLFFLFSACVSRTPHPAASFPIKLTREEILAQIKENLEGICFLRANLKAQIEYPGETKLKKSSFDGAILYRRDNTTIRIQSFSNFGNIIFDLFYRPQQATVY
ncbi:MAG: hypothetical protein N3A64_05455, partial [Desulfobacterota bacterium]|nr:hypothetical protein [Thermodesulfobacteriota bacterium]